ncbi:MAG: bifunctional oligoribonuclease/PAP phosphatase NrnA [Bacteroidales bacterium]|nr:bifunctional oligoribonuclease/PAP phosphatase NrnA [Bacteroidales bacterium]MBD5222345.1 bifunctional oligoribonuclease/PAP phosphatase NrnA [Bacteroidales bacterium]
MLTKILKEADIKRLTELVKRAERIVLTCHVRPDGDAIGSTLGFAHLFSSLGKEVKVVTPDQAPRSLTFLPGFRDVVSFTRYSDYARRLVSEADLLICCDFNTPSRLDNFASVVTDAKCPKVLIDHHVEPDAFCDVSFSFPEMSSTCELVFRIIAAMGYYPEMNVESATCLCTGLITDTQNFTVNCSDPEIYEVLMKLLAKGVDKPRIVREALKVKSLDAFRLQAYALDRKLELHSDSHLAVVTLSASELEEYRYERGDSEGIVDRPLEIKSVVACFFLREDSDCIKVSARSISDFPVNEICKKLFSGGGHVMAAGGEYKSGTLEDCRRILIEAIPSFEKQLRECYKKGN